MTPRQRERVSLYQQVIKNCTESKVVAASPGLRKYLHGFRSAVAGISCIDYLSNCIKEDKVPSGEQLYPLLLPFAEGLGRGLLDFAGEMNNQPLQDKINYTLSHFRVPSRDIRSAAFVALAEEVDEWMPRLGHYGIDGSILNSFNISVENYMGVAPSLSHILSEPEAYQVCFGNVLRTGNLILKDRIDGFMDELSEAQPLFYLSYRRIRTYADINYLV